MPSKGIASQMTELADVADGIMAFEEQNNCLLRLTTYTDKTDNVQELFVLVEAFEREKNAAVLKLLASVNVRCWALNLRSWNSVLTHALYALDFQLVLAEFDRNVDQQGTAPPHQKISG